MECKVCGQDNPPEAGFCAKCGATLVTEVEAPAAEPAAATAYMGFWIRFGAAIIDGIVISLISSVLQCEKSLAGLYPPLHYASAFSGIAWDKQKPGWHDTVAGTYVVKAVKTEAKE